MGRAIIMHIDEAPWVRGGPPGKQTGETGGGQLIGDLQKGPWIHVNWLPPGTNASPHSHSQDEIMYIVDGGFTMGKRECGPGTVLYIEKDTQYGFKVGPKGVRFLNIRPGGLATITMGGMTRNPYMEKAEKA